MRQPTTSNTPLYLAQDADEETETAPQYFRLLSESTGPNTPDTSLSSPFESTLGADITNQGYYERFFVELAKLGRGARGTVFLCQHVLHGHALGKYAIKKVPIGDHTYV